MNNQKNRKINKNKGITLIALVITIIVLLILAGVSIAMLTGDNGILSKASQAGTTTAHQAVYEKILLQNSEYVLAKTTEGYTGSLTDYLQDHSIIKTVDGVEGYIINVTELMGEKQKYGNGTDGKTDVYKIEETIESTSQLEKVASTKKIQLAKDETTSKEYNIYYCSNEENKILLGSLNEPNNTSNQAKIEKLDKFVINYYTLTKEWYIDTDFIRYVFFNKMIDELKLTDEELIVYMSNALGNTNFTTFEEIIDDAIKQGYIEKNEVTTAQEFFEKVENVNNRQKFINCVYNNFWIDIYNEEGEISGVSTNPYITYTINIKSNSKTIQEYKFKISIDKYEIVNINGFMIGIYDFEEHKWLSIESGKCKNIIEDDVEKDIPNNLIIKASEQNLQDDLGNVKLIDINSFDEQYYEFNLTTSEPINVKGYAEKYIIPN